jgi:hypothetical protein
LYVPHHLFPAIPHYRLGELHRMLKRWSPENDRQVIECHGTFRNPGGRITIIDEMTRSQSRAAGVLADLS